MARYSWHKKKNPALRKIRNGFLALAFAAAVPGVPMGYRHLTMEEQTITVGSTINGDDGQRLATDQGILRNETSYLGLKFPAITEDFSSILRTGGVYKVKTIGIGFMGPKNIVSVTVVRPPDYKPDPASFARVPFATPAPEDADKPASFDGPRAYNNGTGEGYALTAAEKEWAHAFFGSDLALDGLRLHFYEKEKKPVLATTFTSQSTGTGIDGFVVDGQHIDFYGTRLAEQDFLNGKPDNLHTFVHEMMHVWQGQNKKITLESMTEEGVYDYTLSSSSKMDDFDAEQQASIVADYALLFLHPSKTPPNRYIGDLPEFERNTQLIRVVEEQFPGARDMRLKAQKTAAYAPAAKMPKVS